MSAVPFSGAKGPTAAVVADRWPLMRVGLARAAGLAGLRVAGEARDLPQAAATARQVGAGVVVLGDIDETTAASVRRLSALLVVVLVRQATRDELARLLAAGVRGVALRSSTPDELGGLLRSALAGESAVSPGLVMSMLDRKGFEPKGATAHTEERAVRAPARGELAAAVLTAKEREVLTALAAGASNQQIAAQLFVTPATVKTHLAHIYAKLAVNGRHEALSRAVALGIVH